MLRFAQHDSPLSFPRMRGNQKGASPARWGIRRGLPPHAGESEGGFPRTLGNWGGMSDFAGLRSGGILDASRWHDRLI